MTSTSTSTDQKITVMTTMFNLLLAISSRISIKAMDYIGTALQLDYNGKPISEQTRDEILTNIRTLTDKLTDPAYMDYLKKYIDVLSTDIEPIVKEKLDRISVMIVDLLAADAADLPKIAFEAVKTVPWLGSFFAAGSMFNDVSDLASSLLNKTTHAYKEVNDGIERVNKIIDSNPFEPPTVTIPQPPKLTNPAPVAPQQHGGGSKKKQVNIKSRVAKSISAFCG